MVTLGDAVTEVERASDTVQRTDVRTQLDSIAVSLEEMIDAKAEQRTDSERAFGDVDFVGSAPHVAHLEEISEKLDGLSEETDDDTQTHIDAARQIVTSIRNRRQELERESES